MNDEEINTTTRLSPRITPELIPEKKTENRNQFTDIDRLELITAIKEYPFLYNSKSTWFDDNTKRNIAWHEISTMIDQPVEACKEVWRSLVNSFKKHRHRKKEAQTLRPWKFDTDMEFLTPYINIRVWTRSQPLTTGNINFLNGDLDEKQQNNIPSTQFIEFDESINEIASLSKTEEEISNSQHNTQKADPQLTATDTEQSTTTKRQYNILIKLSSGTSNNQTNSATNSPEKDEENIDTREVEKQSTMNGTQQTITTISQDKIQMILSSNETINSQSVIVNSHESPVMIIEAQNDPEIQMNPNENSKVLEGGTTSNTAHKSTMTETTSRDEIDMFFSSIATTVKKFSPLNKALAKSNVFAVISEIEMTQIVENLQVM